MSATITNKISQYLSAPSQAFDLEYKVRLYVVCDDP